MTWFFWKPFADTVTGFIFLLTMQLEGSFCSWLRGWPPSRSHSTATLLRKKISTTMTANEPSAQTGLAPHGTLNYLSRCHGINLSLNQWKHKGSQVPFETMVKQQRRERARLFIFMCICLMEISMTLAIVNSQSRQRKGGFQEQEGNEMNEDSLSKDNSATEGVQ